MKLIKLRHDYYIVIDKGVEVASTKPIDEVKKLDLFEVRQLVANVSKIPEDLMAKFESLDPNLIQEVIRVYTTGYMQAEHVNRDRKYTDRDLIWALHQARHSSEYTIKEIVESLEPKLSWNVEFVGDKLKLK